MNKVNPIYEYVKSIKSLFDKYGIDTELSLSSSHVEHLGSYVITRKPNGGLIRFFHASTLGLDFGEIQFHTHKYGITITPLTSGVIHHTARISESNNATQMECMNYTSAINSIGKTSFVGKVGLNISENRLPIGSQITLSDQDIHTVSCGPNDIWIIEEHPTNKSHNAVYGMPFKPPAPQKASEFDIRIAGIEFNSAINDYLSAWDN